LALAHHSVALSCVIVGVVADLTFTALFAPVRLGSFPASPGSRAEGIHHAAGLFGTLLGRSGTVLRTVVLSSKLRDETGLSFAPGKPRASRPSTDPTAVTASRQGRFSVSGLRGVLLGLRLRHRAQHGPCSLRRPFLGRSLWGFPLGPGGACFLVSHTDGS